MKESAKKTKEEINLLIIKTTSIKTNEEDLSMINRLIEQQEQHAAIEREKRRNYTKKQEDDELKFASQFLKFRTERNKKAPKEMTRKCFKEIKEKNVEKETTNTPIKNMELSKDNPS